MEFEIDFFRDEVRNGFYIPAAIKQAWAATLEVLSEIDRICRKHDISYFADWGTLLGAVRHGGFVPWDDDLDICMKRDDYIHFRKVADAELPKGYVLHDYERKENHWEFLVRVVNNDKMCFDEAYLSEHNNFPWLASIDIFLKDYIYPDREEEQKRDREIMKIYTVAQAILDSKINQQALSDQLNEIVKKHHVSLPEKCGNTDIVVALYRLAEQQMTQVKSDETDRIGQIFPWLLKFGPNAGEDKKLYEKVIRLPFENTTIPVPAYYNRVLTSRYGNYNEIRKVWTGHNYPFFEGQKEEIERIAGINMPQFTFNKLMLERPMPDKSRSFKTTAIECMEALKEMLSDAEKASLRGQKEFSGQILTECQQIAADFGTLMETVKGEKNPHTVCVVGAIQDFCDSLWQEYQDISKDGNLKLTRSPAFLEKVVHEVNRNIDNIREVVFLPIGSNEWKGFEDAYEKAIKEENTEVFVVPLPLLKKDFFGHVKMTDEEIEKALQKGNYPKNVVLTDWQEYKFSLHCPEKVYIQNPYDDANPCLTVPPNFYASRIRKFTEEITYIPFARTGEFGKEDINDQYNMKHYVAAPGIIYSDHVIVQSENIREQYIRCLTDFAGKDTTEYWENKIRVSKLDLEEPLNLKTRFKRIVFCIGANELMEHKEVFVSSVRKRLNIFLKNEDWVSFSVAFYPNDRTEWERVDKRLSDEIFYAVNQVVSNTKADLLSIIPAQADRTAKDYDAYYGSPSPLVPSFIIQGKPVMLADYDV